MDNITETQTAWNKALQQERNRLESGPNNSCTVQPVSDAKWEPTVL